MSLKVFDLECDHGHVFEGWFGSADNYEFQRARGLLSCPVCNSQQVTKKLSAPRLNVSHIRKAGESTAAPAAGRSASAMAPTAASAMVQMQADALRHIRKMVQSAENVGLRFAEEARRMHEGATAERAIRGTATQQEREELVEEGIAVMPIPDFLDDDRLQ